METPSQLQSIYQSRFATRETYRLQVWRVLIDHWFGRWIKPEYAVLDLGCGHGEFINQISARKKYGMDLNPATKAILSEDIHFLEQDCSKAWDVPADSLDLVFTSNFFEHLPDKTSLGACLEQVHRSLKPGGRLVAMGPNIAAVHGSYWHFWDHYLPLTELSLAEGLKMKGFEVELALARTLPYTMVGALQYPVWMIALYLKLPFVWRLFGKQFLVVVRKPLIP